MRKETDKVVERILPQTTNKQIYTITSLDIELEKNIC